MVTCLLSLHFFYFMVCVCMHVYTCVHARVHVCHVCVGRSEDSFQESVLACHHVGAKDQIQVYKLGGKHLYHIAFLK